MNLKELVLQLLQQTVNQLKVVVTLKSDYSIGTASSHTLNISVCSGYYVAVRFSSDCGDTTCPFQPASINSSTTHILYFKVPNRENIESFNANGERRDVSFLFSTNIVTNNV